MQLNPSEISELIKSKIENLSLGAETRILGLLLLTPVKYLLFLNENANNVPLIQLFVNICENTFLHAPNETTILALHSFKRE